MSVKPSVAMNAVRAPRPSSRALVATVIPWENSATALASAPARSSTAAHGRQHPLGLILGSGRRLGGDQPAVDRQHGIGEGPADVDAQEHHRDGIPPPRRRRNPRARASGPNYISMVYAASAAGSSSVSARC